jgi:hypothetical protein
LSLAGIAVLLTAIVLLFSYEVVFQGRTFLPLGVGYGGVMGGAGPWGLQARLVEDPYRWDRGASSWQTEPHARAVAAAYAAGRLPLWNPHQGLGAPLAANAQSGAFDVLRLPLLMSGHPLVWDGYYLLRMLLALGLTFVFVRRAGLCTLAAVTAAVAYVFSGFMLVLGNNHFLEVYLLLPGLLWGTELMLSGRPRAGLLVTATMVAMSTLAGMPESTLLTFIYGASYGAYRWLVGVLTADRPPLTAGRRADGETGRRGHEENEAGGAAASVSGAPAHPPHSGALASNRSTFTPSPHPSLLPSESSAVGGRRSVVGSGVLLVLAWLIGLGLAGPLIFPLDEYLRESFHIHTPDIKLGLAYQPLAKLALLGIPYLHGLPARPIVEGPPPGVIAYVGAVPLVLAGLGALSVRLRGVAPLGVFALGSLLLWSAKIFGVPGINEVGRLPILELTLVKDWGLPMPALSAALLAGVGVHAIIRAKPHPWALLGTLGLFASYLAASASLNWPLLQQVSQQHVLSTLGLAVALGLLAWGLLVARHRVPGDVLGALCCGLVIVELFWHAPKGIYQPRHDPLTPPPFVRFLEQRRDTEPPFRVFGLGGLLYPNAATAFRLDDLRSLDALYPYRYFEYVRTFLAPTFDRYLGIPRGRWEGETRLADNPFLDLAGVRYVILPPAAPLPDSAARQLRRAYAGEVEVLENPRALPRAFLVSSTRSAADPAQAVAAMKEPGFDPRITAIVEGAFPDSPDRGTEVGEATVLAYRADRVEIAVRAPARRLLVLTDVYYPGWKAYVDGRDVPILPTDLAFRGVVVEPGEQRVVFVYQPASLALGLGSAALAALALLGGLGYLSLQAKRP